MNRKYIKDYNMYEYDSRDLNNVKQTVHIIVIIYKSMTFCLIYIQHIVDEL